MNETTDIHDHGNKEKYCGQSRISLCGAGSLFYYFIIYSVYIAFNDFHKIYSVESRRSGWSNYAGDSG